MGDPKKLRKKYSTPVHPWKKTAIDAGRIIRKEYGLRNRKEILIATSFLKKYKDIAKRLIADNTAQGEREKKQMLDKLQGLGLLSSGIELEHVLSLELKDILERRVQSLLFRKGLARSMNQARQFIVHRHVVTGNKCITFPSYLMTVVEENQLGFKTKSNLSDVDHPERSNPAKEIQEEAEAVKPKKTTKKEESKTDEEKVVSEEPVAEEAVPETEEVKPEPVEVKK
jgi:small subunit ribosomal protein S4